MCKSSKSDCQNKVRWFNVSMSLIFLDDRFQNELADVSIVYAQVSHEKTKRGPPTNKNISARNIKAQIANMSSNESAGFKSEYQVRITILNLFSFDLFYETVNTSYNGTYIAVSFCKIYH